MSTEQQRKDEDDAVRSAFREHGPFPRRWPISNEDLGAYLTAEYDISDDNESVESVEARETDPLLAAGDRETFTPTYSGYFREQVVERWYLILEPRQKRQSNLGGPKCVGLGCIVLGLILLGIIYLGSPALKAMLFPEDQNATAPVPELT